MAQPSISHFGRYRIISELASGGMATVYRATLSGSSGFEKSVALKVMHTHLAKERHHRLMFEEEARTGALLNHRAIIETLDYGVEQNQPYIATEFLDGKTLEQALKGRRRLTPDVAMWILVELLDALAHAHGLEGEDGEPLGIVHRDISPQNIFLTRDGRVKLIDFGIALREGRQDRTQTGLIKGKFRYMSPEQARGEIIDSRSDIYSLGLVMVYSLTGKKPHGKVDQTAQLIRQAQEGLGLPGDVLSGLEPELAELFERMLAVDKADRPFAEGLLVEAEALLANLHPQAGRALLQTWMDAAAEPARKKPAKGTGAKPRGAQAQGEAGRGSGKKTRAAAEPSSRSRKAAQVRGVAQDAGGFSPVWIFLGLITLFIMALVLMVGGRG